MAKLRIDAARRPPALEHGLHDHHDKVNSKARAGPLLQKASTEFHH
ncbi:MAG: hypothetical protein AB7I48_23010 [Planctomycetaceae bacterium]